MLRDKRDSSDMNANKIKTLIGKYEGWQSLSSFTFWDDDNKEYNLKSLLELILIQSNQLRDLNAELEATKKELSDKLELYHKKDSTSIQLVAKAQDLLSSQLAETNESISEIKDKIKFI